MSEHPLDLSARLIESGDRSTPPNRVTQELSELADGIAVVESFSHVVAVDSGDGLVLFDSSGVFSGAAVVESLRTWSTEPVHTLIYTHGHVDHVGGSGAIAADADARGHAGLRVVGHERVVSRFERYGKTAGYNLAINLRQFGGAAAAAGAVSDRPFLPPATLWPTDTYEDARVERVGDITLESQHCLGETDDHTWTWIPEHRMITAGDQFIWNFPNCGNPQKVQRYPLEWADSLRAMVAKEPELFMPAHGLPIAGRARIAQCLETVAATLVTLVGDVLDAMNAGATLDTILHSVSVPDDVLALPYLAPMYDEPEFVIRNVWRLYGGWYDGNPARLKPAADSAIGAEVIALAGGVTALVERATVLSDDGDDRLACQIIEFAAAGEPESKAVHEARSVIYARRRARETSLMSKGIFKSAQADSDVVVTGEVPPVNLVLTIGEQDGTPSTGSR